MPRILTLRRRAFFFTMRLRFCRMSIMVSRMLLPSLARVLLLCFRHRLPALWCCSQTLEHCMNADWTAGSFSRAARNLSLEPNSASHPPTLNENSHFKQSPFGKSSVPRANTT